MRFTALTPEQARFFEQHGYLVVPHALNQPALERVIVAVDRIYDGAEGREPS